MKNIENEVSNMDEDEAKDMLINCLEHEKELLAEIKELKKNTYTVVEWPGSQDLMGKRWFRKEAILENDGKFGSSAYLVPTHRLE